MQRFVVAAVSAAAVLFCVGHASAQQSRVRWDIEPKIGLARYGARWKSPDDAATYIKHGAGNGPEFGVSVVRTGTGTVSFDAGGSIAFTEYSTDLGPSDANPQKVRGVGSLRILRLGATALVKASRNGSGFFELGAGALYWNPGELPAGGYTDESAWVPSAHIGAGVDFRSRDHVLRLDGRFYFNKALGDIETCCGDVEPKMARDFVVALGYLI